MINTSYKPQNPEIEKLQNALDYACMLAELRRLGIPSICGIGFMLYPIYASLGVKHFIVIFVIGAALLVSSIWMLLRANRLHFISTGSLLILFGLLSPTSPPIELDKLGNITYILFKLCIIGLGVDIVTSFNRFKNLNANSLSSELIDIAKTNIKSLNTRKCKNALNFVEFIATFNSSSMFRWRGYLLPDCAIIYSARKRNEAFVLEKDGFELTVSNGEEGMSEIKHPYFDSPIKVRIPKTSLERLQNWLEKHD